MELRQLEYFAAVARHGHFRRAAEEVHVTQSALSQQVAKLERELGLSLLNRVPGQAVTPTAAGEDLLARAEALLSHLGEIRAAMEAHAGARRGIARIAVTAADATWLGATLAAFQAEHPGIQLAVRQDPAGDVAALLRRGTVDLAVCGLRAEHERDLEVTVLADSPLVAILPPGDARADRGELAVSDLAEDPLMLGLRGTALRDLVVSACNDAGFSPLPRFEVGDPATVRALVAAGLGVAVVPADWLRPPGPEVAVARLADAPRHRTAMLSAASPSPAARLLAERIRGQSA